MLDVSRIEQNRMSFELKEVNAIPVIKEAYERMVPIAEEDGDHLILELNMKQEVVILVDFKRFQQVIQNLVDNAIKFTNNGTVTIKAEIRGKYLKTSIIDTGIGISKENIKNLFTKFYQVSEAINRPKGGSGLGLYISKNIVEKFGGKIKVTSEKGKGSTFSFTVPIVDKK
jgi:signal transduction histidine kinase